eukprot:a180682_32.p1 GENE.a180682_32~~a180682_32.p1  ORF type:complete len:274 (-),score=57.96 a180682_32:547-1326(-)
MAAALTTAPGVWSHHEFLGGGTVDYCPQFIGKDEADALLALCLPHDSGPDDVMGWKQDEIVVGARRVTEPRLTTFLGEHAGLRYTYSSKTNISRVWPAAIASVRERLEAFVGHPLNVTLCNLYVNGKHHVGWHSDSETDLVAGAKIATVSLGFTRKFQLRHRTDSELGARQSELNTQLAAGTLDRAALSAEDLAALAHVVGTDPERNAEFPLSHGDALVMGGTLQQHWRHRVPQDPGPDVTPRIVFTFRYVRADCISGE